jgi:hypothetical protein
MSSFGVTTTAFKFEILVRLAVPMSAGERMMERKSSRSQKM